MPLGKNEASTVSMSTATWYTAAPKMAGTIRRSMRLRAGFLISQAGLKGTPLALR